jgi:hypothetical protein
VKLVVEEQRQDTAAPSYHEVVEMKDFTPTRATDKPVSGDRFGGFSRTVACEGWRRVRFLAAPSPGCRSERRRVDPLRGRTQVGPRDSPPSTTEIADDRRGTHGGSTA